MATYLSPGVYGTEIDLTSSVPSVATGITAFAGVFTKGQAFKRTLVTTVDDLVSYFGTPTDTNYNDWYQCYNFLKYGSELYVVRAVANDDATSIAYPSYISGRRYAKNQVCTYLGNTIRALVDTSATPSSSAGSFIADSNWADVGSDGYTNQKLSMNAGVGITSSNSLVFKNSYIPNEDVYAVNEEAFKEAIVLDTANMIFYSKFLGTEGNKISISFSNDLSKCIESPVSATWNGLNASVWTAKSYNSDEVVIYNKNIYKSLVDFNTVIPTSDKTKWEKISHSAGDVVHHGEFNWTSKVSNNYLEPTSDNTSAWTRAYSFDDLFENSLSSDGTELALIVMDNGTIVEKYIVSTKEAGVDEDSNNIFIDNVLLKQSNYIYSITEQTDNTPTLGQNIYLAGGFYGAPSDFDLIEAYQLFTNAEDFDVSVIIANERINQTALDIATDRADCIAIAGAPKSIVTSATPVSDLVEYISNDVNVESSYAAFYGNYIQIVDTYNSKYRWVNIAGAIAGSQIRTNSANDPWWANAGLDRGQISNVVKIAFNPTKGERDVLYKNKINPIVSTPGQGNCIIWGQKTMLSRSSAFNRINVRQLFLVIEKAVNKAMKYFIFEPNDEFTRAQVIAMIGPFMEDIKGRRGIYEYKIVCDESINTAEVIDANTLKVNILVKTTRVAEFIEIKYVAAKTGDDLTTIAKSLS